MKIRKLTKENYDKTRALLKRCFGNHNDEINIFDKLHNNQKQTNEWICIQANKVIAYICFSRAFNHDKICGLYLSHFTVKPDFKEKNIETELLKFSLRQPEIKNKTIFTHNKTSLLKPFGFTFCKTQVCTLNRKKSDFLTYFNNNKEKFTIQFEPEFYI